MSFLSKNIKFLREKSDFNQLDFALALGHETNSVVSNWEKGKREPDYTTLAKIAKLGNVSIDSLLNTDLEYELHNTNTKKQKGNFFPIIAKCFAGEPEMIFQDTNIEDQSYFTYSKVDRCFALRVVGDSMSGGNHKSIDDGDIVLVDMDADIMSGDVVLALLQNGRELIKQYQNDEADKIRLVSFNLQYPPIILKETDIIAMYRVMERNKTTKF